MAFDSVWKKHAKVVWQAVWWYGSSLILVTE
jgi:hypothetical protein